MRQNLYGILDDIDNKKATPIKLLVSGFVWAVILVGFVYCLARFAYIFS